MSEMTGGPPRPQRAPRGEPGPRWGGPAEETVSRTASDSWNQSDGTLALASPRPVAERVIAPFGRRAIGFLIDLLLVVLLASVIEAIVDPNGAAAASFGFDATALRTFVLQFAYQWVWNSLGWSPGKRVVGVELVTKEGEAPGVGRGLARTMVAVVSGNALAIGYLWAWRQPQRRTWHDLAAGTYVVVTARDEEEEQPPAGP